LAKAHLFDETISAFARDVIDDLSQHPKRLSPKYFYDATGSELFEQITVLPEYYPTRTELGILRDRGGVEVIRKLGDTLNAAGELCRKAGLTLCYHNHAFEYQPTPDGRLLDVLMKTADPKLVSLELDVMWAHVGGADPVSILQQYGDRIPLLHLKNVAPAVETRYNEEIPHAAFRELGNGAVDIPAVLRAAKQAGVKHYFVEQDYTPGDPLQSLRESFQYLEGLKD